MAATQGRSVQQLAEVLATLASCSTDAAAAQGGAQRIADCFDAEVGAVIEGRKVVAAVGFGVEGIPEAQLVDAVVGLVDLVPLPGAGSCPVIVVPVPSEMPRSLLLARSGQGGFSGEEVSLLHSMGRILATVFDMLALRDRVGASEARIRRIVETASEGIWIFDADGQTTFANPKMAEVLGYPPDAMAALRLFDVLDEPGRVQAARNLERRRQGLSDQLECSFIRRDGSRVWVLLNASPLHDSDGEYVGSVCLMSDITQRRTMEVTLQRREQQLAEAQRVARLGSWEWDVVSDRLSCSDELYRVFGIRPDELEPTYAGYLSHVHPADRLKMNDLVADALGGNDFFQVENRIVSPGRDVVWVQVRGEVVRDESGAPWLLRGTVLDVTASKLTENALRETTARYQLLQVMATAANEASSVEMALRVAVDEICTRMGWVVGLAYLLPGTAAGPAAGHLHGVPVGGPEARGDPVVTWHLAPAERFGALPGAISALVETGAGMTGRDLVDRGPAWITDLRHDAPSVGDQLARDLGLRGALSFPVFVDGDVACILGFFSRQPLEPDAALRETICQVATQLSRVAERQRASDELATARDAAMEASRLKSDFLATMSHEIRTPMNGVIGLTGLLLNTELDEQQRQYTEGVESAGEALLAIINDILDFSKIEAGRLELEVIDFDLVQVMEEAAGLVAQTAQRKGLELVVHCCPDLPTHVRGDPARLRQVLLDLASNAVKFTSEGEVVIRAELSEESPGGVVIRFEVADTGIGIDEVDRSRLFEPFSQADASTTRRYGGTGLGLAISRRLVDAMGGEIGVDSEPGRGSTFWFTLPLSRPSGPPGLAAPLSPDRLACLRVLVVDDNSTNRLILRDQLGAWGMAPDLAADAASALERLREAATRGLPYDLALLDACMPEMDGWQLARQVADDPASFGEPRLVVLTSVHAVGAARSRQAGVSACLTKPVRLAQLYDCLLRVLTPLAGDAERTVPDFLTPVPPNRGRVLVVEDNTSNQLVAVGILRMLGFRSDVAANGLEALDALARCGYAAVLMDCQMPEMDGYSATAEFRRREKEWHTPVIAMTAGATEADRDRCLASGMDDYLAKPVRVEEVEAALARWIEPPPVTAVMAPAVAPVVAPPVLDDDGAGEVLILDEGRLDLLRGMGPPDCSLLAEVVEAFLQEAPAHLASLGEAVGAKDGTGVAHDAHRLRGQALTLGAVALAARCAALEELASAWDLDNAPELLAGIGFEFDRAAMALRAAVVARPR